jgi:hypothetical protein
MKKNEEKNIMETGVLPNGTIICIPENNQEVLVITEKEQSALRNYFKSLKKDK